MTNLSALEASYNAIIQADSAWSIFGDLGPTPADELKKKYRQLSKIIHPDLFKGDPKAEHMADEAMSELNRLRDLASDQIAAGAYGMAAVTPRPTARRSPTTSITIDDLTYDLSEDALQGDFCQIFKADKVDGRGLSEPVILKIPLNIADNDLLTREADILKAIHHKSLPVYLSSFHMSDGRLVNVFRPITGGYDLISVRKKFLGGLPLAHAVWVMDRSLSVLGYLHSNVIIHGSIEPGNLMIVPDNHNGLLIDFVFAIQDAISSTAHYLGKNDYTAPEVIRDRKLRPHPVTDMYSLGLTMLYLLGGDPERQLIPRSVDGRFRKFLNEFLIPDPDLRARDAWEYHRKLRALRVEIFGTANQFLPLTLS